MTPFLELDTLVRHLGSTHAFSHPRLIWPPLAEEDLAAIFVRVDVVWSAMRGNGALANSGQFQHTITLARALGWTENRAA